MTDRSGAQAQHSLRPMKWWVAVVAAAAVALSIAVALWWLLSIARGDAQLRIEAIKVGLSVGAGVAGGAALLLAFRRQWLSEHVANDTAHDATERRVTELYGQAVEQLGHEKAAVRLGGLYSLERLALDHREHRQTVVDVVCAYLRMPFELPAPESAELAPPLSEQQAETEPLSVSGRDQVTKAEQAEAQQELQVRLAAQRLLTRHLHLPATDDTEEPSRQYPDTYWDGTRIDLTNALLVDFDFSHCRPAEADFTHATFTRITLFNAAQFSEVVEFGWAHFSEVVEFDGARFSGEVGFGGARFSGDARFNGARFSGNAEFDSVHFSEVADFDGARFSGNAGFIDTEFSEVAGFGGARFSGDARFNGARFSGNAEFDSVHFSEVVDFDGARFSGNADFIDTEFSRDARFSGAQFNGYAGFDGARFSGYAGFDRAQFNGVARFGGAQFNRYATSNLANPSFDKAVASYRKDEHVWPDPWQVEPAASDEKMGRLTQRQAGPQPHPKDHNAEND